MKILITGSRNIALSDVGIIRAYLDKRINRNTDIVVHGGAHGVDNIADIWCHENSVSTEVIKSLFDTSSYYLHRNAEMVGMCDKCFAFWNGTSRGTMFTYNYAKAREKPCELISL